MCRIMPATSFNQNICFKSKSNKCDPLGLLHPFEGAHAGKWRLRRHDWLQSIKLLSNPASLGQFKHHKTSAHDNRPNPWTWNISNFQRVIPNKQTSSSSSSTTTTAATATWLMMNSSSFFALHPSLKDQSSLKRVAHALKIHHNHPSAVTANLAPMDIPHMAAWCWHYVTTDKQIDMWVLRRQRFQLVQIWVWEFSLEMSTLKTCFWSKEQHHENTSLYVSAVCIYKCNDGSQKMQANPCFLPHSLGFTKTFLPAFPVNLAQLVPRPNDNQDPSSDPIVTNGYWPQASTTCQFIGFKESGNGCDAGNAPW